MPDKKNDEANLPKSDTGNSINPTPGNLQTENSEGQLHDSKAEKYLRESGKIEDLPDEDDQKEMDKVIRKEND